jgi:cardiolipin synthase A/B
MGSGWRKGWKRLGTLMVYGFVSVLLLFVPGCTWTVTNSGVAHSALQLPSSVREGENLLVWRSDIKKVALDMIQNSKRIVHMTMYELGDPDILNALAEAHRRGVDVRLVLDATESHTKQMAIPFLEKEGIPYRLLHVSNGISHIKSLVTDDAGSAHRYRELMGGMNFGPNSWNNLDASVLLEHTTNDFEELFQRDWETSAGVKTVEVHSSLFYYDRQIEPVMIQSLQQAKESIEIAAFNLSDPTFIRQLTTAASRGVKIRVLLEPKERQNQNTAKVLRNAGVEVKFYRPVQNEILHAKLVSVDGGKVVWIGSANFSRQAFQINHEGDLVFHNAFAFGKSIHDCLNAEWERSQSKGNL